LSAEVQTEGARVVLAAALIQRPCFVRNGETKWDMYFYCGGVGCVLDVNPSDHLLESDVFIGTRFGFDACKLCAQCQRTLLCKLCSVNVEAVCSMHKALF